MPTVLLAEDDRLVSDALSSQLRKSGFQVELAANGAVAEYLLGKEPIDVAIIDIGLPLIDGLTVVRRARESGSTLPMLVLTALDSLDDRVAGLNAGADDYLTKPFDFPELEARLHALLRRVRGRSRALRHGRLAFDQSARRATVADEPIELSPREWSLLELLLSHRDQVVTKAQINQIWDQDRSDGAGAAGNSIEVHIHRLRRKLEGAGVAIRTVRGLGYLLEEEPAAP